MNAIDELRMRQAAPMLLAAAQKAMDECCDLIATPAGDALEAAIAAATGGADHAAPQGVRLIADLGNPGVQVALRVHTAAPLRPFGIEFDPEDQQS